MIDKILFHLWSIATFADKRAASTRSLREDDPVRMLRGSLHELDAGVVLPVTHGLLEQGLVNTTAIVS